MILLVWHRHSCRCLLPREGHLRTDRSTSTPPRENRARRGPQCLCHTVQTPHPAILSGDACTPKTATCWVDGWAPALASLSEPAGFRPLPAATAAEELQWAYAGTSG